MELVISSHKAIRLARCHLPLTKSYWLFPVTILSFIYLEMAFRKICSITFPILASLYFRGSSQDNSWLSWWWTQHLSVFHSSGISPDCHYLSKMKKASLWQVNQVFQYPWMQPIYSLWLTYVLSSCIVGYASLPQTLLLCSGRPEGRTLL